MLYYLSVLHHSIVTYTDETWASTKEDEEKLTAFEYTDQYIMLSRELLKEEKVKQYTKTV